MLSFNVNKLHKNQSFSHQLADAKNNSSLLKTLFEFSLKIFYLNFLWQSFLIHLGKILEKKSTALFFCIDILFTAFFLRIHFRKFPSNFFKGGYYLFIAELSFVLFTPKIIVIGTAPKGLYSTNNLHSLQKNVTKQFFCREVHRFSFQLIGESF